MANIQIVPVFGTSFQVYVPLLMILVAIITFFDGFAQLLKLVGVESEESFVPIRQRCSFSFRADNNLTAEDQQRYDDGKRLIGRQLKQSMKPKDQISIEEMKQTIASRTSMTSGHSPLTGSVSRGIAGLPLPSALKGKHRYSNIRLSSEMVDEEEDDEVPHSFSFHSAPKNRNWSQNTRGSNFRELDSRDEDDPDSSMSSQSTNRGATITNPLNKMNAPSRNPPPSQQRDLFSIDDSDENVYVGRYADV